MNREEFIAILEENRPNINGKKIYIWGTGHTAQLYEEGLKRITKFEVSGYCDNNKEKWNTVFQGKPVVSPQLLGKIENVFVMICTPQENIVKSVGKQLDEMKIEWCRLDAAICKLYKDEVVQCYDLLQDELSKEIYAHIVYCRITNTMPQEKYISGDQYFALREFKTYGKEVFVDCGAFTGDTIERYIWVKYCAFKRIYAFEPDANNFLAMQYRIERLKKEWNLPQDSIRLFPYGVGKQTCQYDFLSNGDMSSHFAETSDRNADGENNGKITVVSLDTILSEPYSFLKADIEGWEYSMIEGARFGISQNKPKIAICIYHNAVDLFSIILLLHQYVPEYKFAVRHHSITFDETVVYAWI